MAYSLLGIFGVFILPMYGEGEDHAMYRLEEAIDNAKNRGQTYLSASNAKVARKSSENNSTEASWTSVIESRRRRASCLNCGEHGHREVGCKKFCGRCEALILVSRKCES
jgi:hypothetical protein